MPNKRRRLTGVVVSNKMQKTVVVEVSQRERHPLYGKVIKRAAKYMAHDEASTCEMGDTVVIVESQPISRHKRWVVQEVIQTDLSARTESVDELDVDPVAEESNADKDDVAADSDED